MLTIYGVPVSVHTRKAIVVAKIKGLAHTVIPVAPVVPGNPPSDWRELSPTGLIPVLSDDGFTVGDSTAICMYLERRYPQHPVYPDSPGELARVLALEAYATERLFRNIVRVLFHELVVRPKIEKRPTDPVEVDRALKITLPEVFDYLNRAASRGHLVGNSVTVADIAVVSNLLTFMYCGFDVERGTYRHLSDLFDRVVTHGAVREALRSELPVVESFGLRSDFLKQLLD